MCPCILVRIHQPLVYFPRDHTAQNAQNGLEMIVKRVQRGNGKRARGEIFRDAAGRVNECACEFG